MAAVSPLVVIADNLRLAQHYARERELGREGVTWRFVHEWRQIRGMAPGRFTRVTLGQASAYHLAEHAEMATYLRATGWEEL